MSKNVNQGGFLRKFSRDQRGTVAMLTGLAAIPMFLAAGIAVDMARASQMKSDFQAALDGAALAVASSDKSNLAGLTGADLDQRMGELQQIAQNYVDQNYKPDFYFDTVVNVDVTSPRSGTIKLTGDHDYPTTMMRIAGIYYVDVTAESTVDRKRTSRNKVEIALSLDTTGSMSGQKLTDAKQAAKDLLEIVYEGEVTSLYVKSALVPFAQTVNVGTGNAAASWLDTTGLADQSNDNFIDTTWHNMRAWNAMNNRPWTGCVEARNGTLDTDDTTPTIGTPNTLFTPWFAPDEPSSDTSDGFLASWYQNSWTSDGTVASPRTADKRQRNQAKYTGISPSTSSNDGPWAGCKGTQPIVPLTNSRTTLNTAIDALTASNYTHVVQGMMWGWRVLSPTEPFTEGTAYDDPTTKKIIVLMTDGANTYPREGNSASTHNRSQYSAYGFLSQSRLGTTNYSTAITRLDQRLTTACTNAKAQNIEVWTVAFDVDDQPGIQNLLRNCATDPSKFLNAPDGASLRAQFQVIAGDIVANSLYLSK